MGRALDIKATPVLQQLIDALLGPWRYIVLEGGTRSSKTHSICQALILCAIGAIESLRPPLEIDIARKEMSVHRAGAMKDFEERLYEWDLYEPDRHNKQEARYGVGASVARFFGTDQERKLRGPERDILWINEANGVSQEEWRQLKRRTRRVIILDYNPSHGATHWIDDEVIGSGREIVLHSTYMDNRFLPEEQVRDIESDVPVYREPDGTEVTDWKLEYDGPGVLIKGDPAAWAVNGLGKRAKAEEIIYKHWTKIDRMPDGLADECYGLDFGYTNPCALVHVGWKDVIGEAMNLIWHELLYKRGLTDEQLAHELESRSIDKQMPMYCDNAEPERIQALRDKGYNAISARKSVTDGIISVKQHRLRITRSSVNLLFEIERYKRRKDNDGNILEEPVEKDDHGMDGGRYGTHTHLKRKKAGVGALSSRRGETPRKSRGVPDLTSRR